MHLGLLMLSKKQLKKVILGAIAAVPYIRARRRRSNILGYVMGGLGVALASGITAVMLFSPRTRYRALDFAKEAYGRASDKMGRTKWGSRIGANRLAANGLVTEHETEPGYGSGL